MIIKGKKYTRDNIGKIFDYAMLNHDKTRQEIEEHVRKGIYYNVNGIHCNPYWVPLIADMLEGTDIETGICPVFPFGAASLASKVREVEELAKVLNGRPGCVDYVINVGALRGKDYAAVEEEARTMAELGHSYGYKVKSIMENAMLTDDEIAVGCQIVSQAGVDYVKAASGRGGTPELSKLFIMRRNIPDHVGIKMSGYGTYCLTQLTIMGLASGAELFGTGFAHTIIEEIEKDYRDLVIS